MMYSWRYQMVFTETDKKMTPSEALLDRVDQIYEQLKQANEYPKGFLFIQTADEKYIPESLKTRMDTKIIITGTGKGNAPGVLTFGITDTLE